MDNIRRAALVAALQQHGIDAKVAEGVQIVDNLSGKNPGAVIIDDPEPEQTNLTPDKARSLLEMFSRQIRELNPIRAIARRLVTAQRPFYERYQFKSHNGKAEMARRVQQMNRNHGSVRVHPGLLFVVNGVRYTTDSHGAVCRFYS